MTKSLHSEPYADFLAVLVAARRAKGFTQQAVADRLQKPQSYVAKIEGGERRLD
ncbi:helix-turn-helix transcriptional regulator, partial [Escherichia coli]|nr:helix-turn-helix transcriptional regulator [Escherichia coli]